MRHWLLKTEPESFSIDDLAAAPRRTTCWDGVRNYQARNFLRDDFRVGDLVLLYHSNADPPAAVGVAEVVRESYPDASAFDRRSPYFDPDSRSDEPRWFMVDVRLVEKFSRAVSLDELRRQPELAGMELLRRGSRLSVQPVSAEEFATVRRLASARPAEALSNAAGAGADRAGAGGAKAAGRRPAKRRKSS